MRGYLSFLALLLLVLVAVQPGSANVRPLNAIPETSWPTVDDDVDCDVRGLALQFAEVIIPATDYGSSWSERIEVCTCYSPQARRVQ